jgi:hypothetical protein
MVSARAQKPLSADVIMSSRPSSNELEPRRREEHEVFVASWLTGAARCNPC